MHTKMPYMFVCLVQSFGDTVQMNVHAAAHDLTDQAPLSMGFSRQDYGVGNHSLLPHPGSTLGVLHCRQIFLAEALGKPLKHQGIPIIKKTKPFKT